MDDELKLLLALDVQTTGLAALDDLADRLERVQAAGELVPTALAAVPEAAATAFDQLVTVVGGRLAEAQAAVATFAADGQAAFGNVDAAIGSLVDDVDGGLQTLNQDVARFAVALEGRWDALWTDVGNTVTTSLAALEQTTQSALAAIAGWFGDLASAVETASTRAGQGMVAGIVAGLAGLAQALSDAISAAISSININVGPFHLSAAGFHIDPPSLPNISLPGFASGTTFAPGGAAVVGESGPELGPVGTPLPRGAQVVPLPSGSAGVAGLQAGAGRGGGGVVVNVTGNYLLAEQDLVDLAERVGQVLARQTGLAYYVNRG